MQFKMTETERLILMNQNEIMKKLEMIDKDSYEEKKEILSHGFEMHYEELNQEVFEKDLSIEECVEVMDILDMHRMLNLSIKTLNAKVNNQIKQIPFEGFDSHEK